MSEPVKGISAGKKKARLRRRLSYLLAVVITTVISFVLYTKSSVLPYQVAKYVNDHYLADTPFEFTCDRIRGDYVHRIVLVNPVLRYHDANSSFNVFRADEVAVDYQLFEVLKLNLRVETLRLEDVHLQMRKDNDGRLIIPGRDGESRTRSSAEGVAEVIVDHFEVNGLHLSFGGKAQELAVRDVNVAGELSYADGVGRLRVNSGSGYVIDTETSLSSVVLDVEYAAGDLTLHEFRVRSNKSAVSATGSYHDGLLDRAQFVFNPIDLKELHKVGLTPDLGSGEFGGNIIIDGLPDSLAVRGTVTGSGFDVSLSSMAFSGSIANDLIDLTHVEGKIFGATVDGGFRYHIGDQRDFNFVGNFSGLDLSQGFVAGVGMPPTDLYGNVNLEYADREARYSMDAEFDSLVFDGYRSYHSSLRASWSEDEGFVADNIFLGRPGYTIDGMGSIDPDGNMDFVASASAHDLTYLWDFFNLTPVEGSANLTARVRGPVDSLQINMSGDATDVRFMFARVDSGFVQAELTGAGTLNPLFKLGLDGRHIDLNGRKFDEPHLYIEIDSSRVGVTDFRFVRGDTTVAMAFDVFEKGPDRQLIDLQRFQLQWAGELWQAQVPAMITIGDDGISADSLVVFSQRGTVGAQGFYSNAQRYCDVVAWGDGVDLALIREAFALPFVVSGDANFHGTVRGDVDDPAVHLRVDATEGVVDSVTFSRLRLDASYDGEYSLENLTLTLGGDTLQCEGNWGFPVSPVSIVRKGAELSSVMAAPLWAQIRGEHFSIPAVMRGLRLSHSLGGAFTGEMIVTGTLDAPVADLVGRVIPREGESVGLPPLSVNISYADNLLRIRDASLLGGAKATVSGNLPVSFSFKDGASLLRGDPVSGRLDITHGDLHAVEKYLAMFSSLDGNVVGSVSLAGSLDNPSMKGDFRLEDSRLQLGGMTEVYTNLNATVLFDGHVLRLVSLSADADRGGAVQGSGTIDFDGFTPVDYQIDATLSQFWLLSIPDMTARVNGRLQVAATDWQGGSIPEITGAVDVLEADITADLATIDQDETALSRPTSTPSWLCTVDINGQNNIWIKNPDMRIEVSGRLILKRDQEGLYLRGDMQALGGRYNIYGNKFHVVDGSLNFSTPSRPAIQLNAYTTRRESSGLERRIYLSLSWPQDQKEPTISLSYDEPGYLEEDLWRMLGGSTIGTGLAINQLERALNERMQNVDIEIDQAQSVKTPGQAESNPLVDPEREMLIGVGRYLWEDVYVRYRQGLKFDSERQVQVEYRLSNLFLLRSEFIRNSRRRLSIENGQYTDEFNFDVKFRWEY